MIVVDASAICAIVFREPEREQLLQRLIEAGQGIISPLNHWEVMVSVTQRERGATPAMVRDLLASTEVGVAPIGSLEADEAFSAWRTFGKGRHPAQLNLGDCFAYALAKSRDLPLLFKGEDFAMTDIRSAL